MAGILTSPPVLYCDTDQQLNYTDTEKRIKCKIIFGKFQLILRQILLQIQINLAVTKQIFRLMKIEKAKQSKVPPCFQKGKKISHFVWRFVLKCWWTMLWVSPIFTPSKVQNFRFIEARKLRQTWHIKCPSGLNLPKRTKWQLDNYISPKRIILWIISKCNKTYW